MERNVKLGHSIIKGSRLCFIQNKVVLIIHSWFQSNMNLFSMGLSKMTTFRNIIKYQVIDTRMVKRNITKHCVFVMWTLGI